MEGPPIKLSLKSPSKHFSYSPDEEISSVKIGRSLKCEFSVPLEDLSREHCLINYSNGEYFITDLNSSNGVWVDRTRITPNQKIKVSSNSLIVLSNIYTLSINPSDTRKNSGTTATNNVVDRELDTISFQLDYPLDKSKKKNIKKIVPQGSITDEDKPSKKKEMIIMSLAFLLISIYLIFEFVLTE